MYDCAKAEVARGERKVDRIEYKEKHLLPLDMSDIKISAPPTPDPFVKESLSATSATAQSLDYTRRRSSSLTFEQQHPPFIANRNLHSVKEDYSVPPTTTLSLERQENNQSPGNHRRRYSGSTFAIGVTRGVVNGTRKKGERSPGIEPHPEEIEEKASWE
jgi:hypothetical protein